MNTVSTRPEPKTGSPWLALPWGCGSLGLLVLIIGFAQYDGSGNYDVDNTTAIWSLIIGGALFAITLLFLIVYGAVKAAIHGVERP